MKLSFLEGRLLLYFAHPPSESQKVLGSQPSTYAGIWYNMDTKTDIME